MHFNEELQGKRLILRRTRPTPEMAELIFRAVDASREHLRPFCPWERNDDSVESCLNYLKAKESKTAAGERIEYGIFVRKSGDYIGNIQLFNISAENQSAEIGYWLAEYATGKGYMCEALRILEKESFSKIGMYRLQLTCNTLNAASAKVIRSCGFLFEGILHGDRYDAYRDRMTDTYLFAKTLPDYLEENKSRESGEYRICRMREYPGGEDAAIVYYHDKWGRKENYRFFKDAIRHSGALPRGIPDFYVLLKGEDIIGCCGLIMNDFISRHDLYPWLCGLYVEEKERGKGLGNMLMQHAERQAKTAGYANLYLTTDHRDYYERYGWKFLGLGYDVSGAGSRIYMKILD